MSFNTYEHSVQNSQPDEAFDFEYLGDNSHYRVTSSAIEITHDSNAYTPIVISRGPVISGAEIERNGLTLKVDRNDSYFNSLIFSSRTFQTELTLYTLQPEDTFAITWKGKIKSVSKGPEDITVTLSPISSTADRPIIHRKYQVQCPHKLFGYYCGVNEATFTRAGTVLSSSGSTLQAAIFATEVDGWFKGGEVTIGSEIKTIIKHVGNTVTLLDGFSDASVSDPLSATAGCEHDTSTCNTKFSNILNYGGCPWIPSDDSIVTGKPFTY